MNPETETVLCELLAEVEGRVERHRLARDKAHATGDRANALFMAGMTNEADSIAARLRRALGMEDDR